MREFVEIKLLNECEIYNNATSKSESTRTSDIR